jgi:hypothetical protein
LTSTRQPADVSALRDHSKEQFADHSSSQSNRRLGDHLQLDRCVFRPLKTQAIVCIAAPSCRFPELRFIMPHLGGGTPALKGRMMAFFETDDADIPPDMRGYLKTQSEQKKFGLTERFEKLFRALYFDTAGTGAWLPAMAAAFNITTPDRIMFGSDYPLECKTAANIIRSIDMVLLLQRG